MEYPIGEFSKLTGLSIHTLRYYEHEGLIAPERNSSNRRCYSDKDLTWIEFIKRLKDTGMPIKEIKHYAELRAAGDSTLSDRMEMLALHIGFQIFRAFLICQTTHSARAAYSPEIQPTISRYPSAMKGKTAPYFPPAHTAQNSWKDHSL